MVDQQPDKSAAELASELAELRAELSAMPPDQSDAVAELKAQIVEAYVKKSGDLVAGGV